MAELFSSKDKSMKDKATVLACDGWLFELHKRILKLETQAEADKKTIEELTKKVDKYENKAPSNDFNMSDLFKVNKSSDGKPIFNDITSTIINFLNSENDEIDKKTKNVIIYGIKEDSNKDEATINNLFQALDVNKKVKIKSVRRFNKSQDSDRISPILVQLGSTDDKFNILKCAKKLKNLQSNYEGVNISPDLTTLQRQLNKNLQTEKTHLNRQLGANSDSIYVIRNFTIVKIAKKQE
jgi:uncharacterized coiled-coil protein SlyX